jgi:5'-3' exonuclease
MIHKYDIKNMLICYDHPGEESMRKSIYPGYKASRGTRGSISAQELIIRKIIELLGICAIEMPGYEADDLIASAARHYKSQRNVVIVTGDKDLLQLIDTNVTVLDTMKKCFYGEEEVMKKFGVKAHQISDFLAIAGDKVDDIPGVTGVGKAGASKLLMQYGTLEGICDNVASIPGALGKKMTAGKDDAFLSKKLSHLYDVELAPDLDTSVAPKYNEDLLSLFSKLQFVANTKKLIKLWSKA